MKKMVPNIYSVVASFFNRVTGAKGCKHINVADGSVSSVRFSSIIVQEDTDFATITGSDGSDLIAYWGISGKTLKQGALLTTKLGVTVVTVDLNTAGSIIGYNE